MSRLIDADELIEFIEDRYEVTWESDTYEGGIKDACSDMLEKIDNMPTIEPQQTCEYWDSESKFCALCRPSAQPKRTEERTETHACDLVERQAVIDTLNVGAELLKRVLDDTDIVGVERAKYEWGLGLIESYISDMKDLPSAQPERTCVNCGRTANNGGWYADGRTRCPIEEHYALPKDGYCHLWEKRNVTDDDYPERQEK